MQATGKDVHGTCGKSPKESQKEKEKQHPPWRARAEWVPAPIPVILRAVRLDSGVS